MKGQETHEFEYGILFNDEIENNNLLFVCACVRGNVHGGLTFVHGNEKPIA